MVIYEVNLEVKRKIIADYRKWHAKHVHEVTSLPGFTGYKIFSLDDKILGAAEVAKNDFESITVHYYVDSRESLQNYLTGPATNMRKEA